MDLSDDVIVVETRWGHPGPERRRHLGKVNHPQGANLLTDISARRAFGHFLLEAVAGKKIVNAVAATSMVAVYTNTNLDSLRRVFLPIPLARGRRVLVRRRRVVGSILTRMLSLCSVVGGGSGTIFLKS